MSGRRLERRDVDWRNPAVGVQRRFARGHAHAIPEDRPAGGAAHRRERLAALELLPARIDTTVLFPNRWGERLNFDNWRCPIWYPALEAACVDKRGPYHLRHTFATEALAAGVSIFQLARLMGTSVAMIDRTYGHMAQDSEPSLRARLAARSDRNGVLLASPEDGGS